MKAIATSSLRNVMNRDVIDDTTSILPVLWRFLDSYRRPCFISMNIYKTGNELVVSIINSKKIRRFKSTDNQNLIEKLSAYLKV